MKASMGFAEEANPVGTSGFTTGWRDQSFVLPGAGAVAECAKAAPKPQRNKTKLKRVDICMAFHTAGGKR